MQGARRALVAALVAILATGCGGSDERERDDRAGDEPTATEPEREAEAPEDPTAGATREQITSQDRVPRERQLEEARVMESRPLLSELPLRIGNDVLVDVHGLAADGERTIVRVQAPGRSREEVERLWSDLLLTYGDRAGNYELEVDT